MDLSTTYTIEQFISMGSSEKLSYENFSLFEKDENGNPFLTYNVLNDYLDELNQLADTVLLDNKSYNKYKYKPKLFCYDIYGSQELYFVLLALNGMCSIKEFDAKKIKAIRANILSDALSYIYNAEKNNITKNRNNLGI